MAKKSQTKPLRKTSQRRPQQKRSVRCTKSHGHLVCWITTRKQPSKKHIFFNFIIPGTHNQHRPHLIRRSSLLVITLLVLGLQVGYNYFVAHQRQILGYATNVSAQTLRAEINESRRQNGLDELTVDQQLSKAASLKADDMLSKNYWSHNAPDGSQPWKWFAQADYQYNLAGENLAKDFRTSKGVTTAWLDSQTHRQNMLNPNFKDVGIAVVNGSLNHKDTTLVVALFGARNDGTAAVVDNESGSAITSTTTSHSSNLFANPAQVSTLFNPISMATLTVLFSVAVVALLTHWHYIKLPRRMRRSWYQHHALYTATFALLFMSYTAYIFTAGSI